ncbi:MAG: HAMP domain-containing sensor histidine kinase [Arcobacteraceae bacterium]
MLLVAFFYYQSEKTLHLDLIKSNVQNISQKISSEIIFSQMKEIPLEKDKYLTSSEFQIGFYNEKKEKLFGNLNETVDFSEQIIIKKNNIIYINDSTVGHLGIYYVVIKEHLLSSKIKKLWITIVISFIFIYFCVALIGIYLSKLFLKPIKDEREKLNNFIKDTTHELNTPISAILMSTQNENLTAKQIQRVKLSARRISEIYKDLTYVFLEHKSEYKMVKKQNLKELIKEQLEYFEPLALKKRVTIVTDFEDFEYLINKDDFIRVFNNLMSNAIKYNNLNGSIHIKLQKNLLVIKDTGIGIAEEKLNDIYKRYFRATNEQGGFGIGLNIVNNICKVYNIKIDVVSTVSKGTAFSLSFQN